MHPKGAIAEIALSFLYVFGYHCGLVGLSTEVEALARYRALTWFGASPSPPTGLVSRSSIDPPNPVGRVAFAQEFSGGQEALRRQFVVWGQ